MCKKYLILTFAALLVIALAGCGIKQLLPGKDVPSLDSYSTVALLPFDFGKPSEDYPTLPTLISYAIGTKLQVRRKDSNLLYDQSQEINHVSEKLAELNISAKDIFEDPLTASKVAEALQADLIIAGQLDEPKFTREDSGKIKYVMDEMTPSGSARYYTIYQTATLPASVKVINPKDNTILWNGKVIGYKKYETDYRTGSPKKFERDEAMLADVRRDFVAKFVDKLYPAK